MKKVIVLFFGIFGCIVCSHQNTLYSQTQEGVKGKSKTVTSLSPKDVERATAITYHFSNGTVAPEWHWSVEISVESDKVVSIVYRGYDAEKVYEETARITEPQFLKFKQKLASLGISKQKMPAAVPVGGGNRTLAIYQDGEQIFSASRYEIQFKTDGVTDLLPFFRTIMPEGMANTVSNPGILLNDTQIYY